MSGKDAESNLILANLTFYETPSHIEGSPYWVDLWTSVNGYCIGLQVKPDTYQSASAAIYAGKARAGQRRGHEHFMRDFGGRVFTIHLSQGRIDGVTEEKIAKEAVRLKELPRGPHTDLTII